jgi:hypothetical protein
MIRNILFFLTVAGALAWVIYAGSNLVNFSEKSNPEKLFGQEDGRIFILNRPQEITIESTDFSLQPRLNELFSILNSTIQTGERIYISERKAHILLQTNDLFSEDQVMSRFKEFNFEKIGTKKYQWKNFKITFFKGIIDCQIESESNNFNDIHWSSFDKKSSCSIIEFIQKNAIIKDYFQNNGSTTIYTRQPSFAETSKSFDDEGIFANHVPSMISSYQFTEKFTLTKKDPVFKKSIAFNWTNSGLIQFEYNNANFLLMDILEGYDPKQMIEMYLDTSKRQLNNYTGLLITETFPHSKSKGFYLKQFDNYVLISESASILNEADVALELGQTLGRFKSKRELVFGNSPKKVVERVWSSNQKKSTSTYKGTIIDVEMTSAPSKAKDILVENQVKSYAMSSSIDDFIVHDSKDLIFATGNENSISGFSNGKNFFNLKITESSISSLKWSKDQTKFYFNTPSKLYAINSAGSNIAGFPVEIKSGIAKEAITFDWQGSENFLVTSLDGSYFWINEKGAIKKTGKTGYPSISNLPNAWLSANRLFFGFKSDSEFTMIDARNGQVFRKFPLSKNAISQYLKNEIKFYDLEADALVQFDQKGNKSKISSIKSPIWIRPISKHENNGFCVKDGNMISCYTIDGEFIVKTKIPFESVDDVIYVKNTKKGPLLGVLDGLSNAIYLYQSNGTPLTLVKSQAQKKILLNSHDQKLSLYTIIDKYVIKYVLQ